MSFRTARDHLAATLLASLAGPAAAETWRQIGIESGIALALDADSVVVDRAADAMSIVLRMTGDFDAAAGTAYPGVEFGDADVGMRRLDLRFSYSCATGMATDVVFLRAWREGDVAMLPSRAWLIDFAEAALASAQAESTPRSRAETIAACESIKARMP